MQTLQQDITTAGQKVKHGGIHSVVMEVVEMVENPAMSVAKLGKVIASHRGLSERVLRIANSPLYAIPGRVSSVNSAITLLGLNALRDTVITLLVHGAMRSMVNAVVHFEQFWNHSISCGVTARILAKRFAAGHEDGAFIAGLFHDMGVLMLGQGGEPDALRLARMKVRTVPAGSAHEEVGSWIAEEWQLGEEIAEAIRFHHAPGRARVNPRLTATVHVADVLCAHMQTPVLQHDTTAEYLDEALDLLGIEPSSLHPESLAEETNMILSDVAAAPDFAGMVLHLKNALVEAIGSLPERQRLTFALYYLEGLGFPEIARVLRLTESEVRALHTEALAVLGRIIHDSI